MHAHTHTHTHITDSLHVFLASSANSFVLGTNSHFQKAFFAYDGLGENNVNVLFAWCSEYDMHSESVLPLLCSVKSLGSITRMTPTLSASLRTSLCTPSLCFTCVALSSCRCLTTVLMKLRTTGQSHTCSRCLTMVLM